MTTVDLFVGVTHAERRNTNWHKSAVCRAVFVVMGQSLRISS
jgi:hypothetical protein